MNAILEQNYTLELFIALKMAYSCCFGLRGNLDFPDFLQKKFYKINYRKVSVDESIGPQLPSLKVFGLLKLEIVGFSD